MKYELFITDYDGTLGSIDTIDSETVSAIKDYQRKGGKFVVCTGRSYHSIVPILNKYGITGDIITFQGAEISSIDGENIIYDGEVDKYLLIEMIEKLKKEEVSCGVYIGGYIHYEFANEEMRAYLGYVGVGAKQVESLKDTLLSVNKNVKKMVVLGEKNKIESLRDKYSKEYTGKLIVNTSSANIMEVINPQNSKGEGVKRIAKYYNIPLSKVITVGDSLNDIELVRGEWHGVAVGDAVDELKKNAKEVTLPFKDNPIKFLLDKYGK
ncbi:MAG: Cof-type HAD-IIB family hydrolase [Firmicutes bacterium]|nr:Cof-type HAD-IIB family hydrolase [Candidatus Caballimonas caccae]